MESSGFNLRRFRETFGLLLLINSLSTSVCVRPKDAQYSSNDSFSSPGNRMFILAIVLRNAIQYFYESTISVQNLPYSPTVPRPSQAFWLLSSCVE